MNDRPRLLDLFCGAGGAGMGYHRAGFEVVGVDIVAQPHYPFEFHLGDALEYCAEHGREFDVIHASPPCQAYSEATPMKYRGNHRDLIAPTRAAILATGLPYIIENVECARKFLLNPLMLCGSMFGLMVWWHRYFETRPQLLLAPFSCRHDFRPLTCTGTGGPSKGPRHNKPKNIAQARMAMGIDWMGRTEINQAIPPAYTEFIGQQLRAAL